MVCRFVLRPVLAPLVCLAALGAGVERLEAGPADEPRAVAATRGRRAAEALPAGRFRTALLAELAILDARRPLVAPTGAAGEIIVTPPEPEPPPVPEPVGEPALVSTPEPAAELEPAADAEAEPLFDSSVALAAAAAAARDAEERASSSPSGSPPFGGAGATSDSAPPSGDREPDRDELVKSALAVAPPAWVDPFAEQGEADRLARETAERQAAEQKAAEEKAAAQRAEAERLERERLEAERREAARMAAERAEAERKEVARRQAERGEAERIAAQQKAEAAAKAEAEAKAAAVAAAAAEVHTPGFGAVCPVTLRDEMRLAPARPEHSATHDGAPWHFATAEARAAFLKNPARYQPIAGGGDVVLGVLEGFRVPGRPDRCAVYQDRLYLFASNKTRAAFVKQPRRYAAAVGQ